MRLAAVCRRRVHVAVAGHGVVNRRVECRATECRATVGRPALRWPAERRAALRRGRRAALRRGVRPGVWSARGSALGESRLRVAAVGLPARREPGTRGLLVPGLVVARVLSMLAAGTRWLAGIGAGGSLIRAATETGAARGTGGTSVLWLPWDGARTVGIVVARRRGTGCRRRGALRRAGRGQRDPRRGQCRPRPARWQRDRRSLPAGRRTGTGGRNAGGIRRNRSSGGRI